MELIKGSKRLQGIRKAYALYANSTSFTVSTPGNISYAFEALRVPGYSADLISTANAETLKLKRGSIYRITLNVAPQGSGEITIRLYNQTQSSYAAGIDCYINTSTLGIVRGAWLVPALDQDITLVFSATTVSGSFTFPTNRFIVEIEQVEQTRTEATDKLTAYDIDAGREVTVSRYTEARLRVGGRWPIVLHGSWPIVCFNGYFARAEDAPATSFRIGHGSTNHHAGYINMDPNTGFFACLTTESPGAEHQPAAPRSLILGWSRTSFISVGAANTTTAEGPNVYISTSGTMMRSTSSAKYKRDIEDLLPEYSSKIYSLRPVWYRSTCESDRNDYSWYGLIAEEVAKVEPRLCTYNKDGEPEGVDYARLSVLLLKELQLMRKELDELKNKETQHEKSLA